MDENTKQMLSIIKNACKTWTTHHKGDTLQLSYESVESLYDLLTELEDIINNLKLDDK